MVLGLGLPKRRQSDVEEMIMGNYGLGFIFRMLLMPDHGTML